jgi:16S rRNA (guanine966-N2)-methyltransferase
MLRIISGIYKNMSIPTIKKANYRPSTGRIREALFSIISSGKIVDQDYMIHSEVLDLFSGSGSLGFEALSRGAKSACFVDFSRNNLDCAYNFATKLNRQDDTEFICTDASNLYESRKKYNLIFLDPPYGRDMVIKSLKSLLLGNWCAENALIAIESSKTEKFDFTEFSDLEVVIDRIYGNSKLQILLRKV